MSPHSDALDAAVRRQFGATVAFDREVHRGPGTAVYAVLAPNGSELLALTALKVVAWPPGAGVEVPPAFLHRAEGAALLRHPHVAPVLRSGVTEHFGWYMTEYQRGETLAQALERDGPMPPEGAHRLILQVASALDYAHRRGVVHGSLKPSDVFLDREGWVRVSDFAIRGSLTSLAAATGNWSLVGRAPFLAPEQYALRHGVPGPAADQYALAALFCACLGIPVEPAVAAWRDDVPSHVRAAVERALHPSAYRRFPTTLAFVAALDEVAAPASEPRQTTSGLRTWNRNLRMADARPVPKLPTRRVAVAAPAAVLAVAALWVAKLQLPAARAGEPHMGGAVAAVPPPGAAPTAATVAAAPPPRAVSERPPPPPRDASPPEKRPPTAPASPPPGLLYLSSRPWGWIYLDGRPAGHTPANPLTVPPGRHLLRIVRDGFEPHERLVEMPPGGTLRLTGIELRRRAQ